MFPCIDDLCIDYDLKFGIKKAKLLSKDICLGISIVTKEQFESQKYKVGE